MSVITDIYLELRKFELDIHHNFIMFITEFSYKIKFKVIYIIHNINLINNNNNVR